MDTHILWNLVAEMHPEFWDKPLLLEGAQPERVTRMTTVGKALLFFSHDEWRARMQRLPGSERKYYSAWTVFDTEGLWTPRMVPLVHDRAILHHCIACGERMDTGAGDISPALQLSVPNAKKLFALLRAHRKDDKDQTASYTTGGMPTLVWRFTDQRQLEYIASVLGIPHVIHLQVLYTYGHMEARAIIEDPVTAVTGWKSCFLGDHWYICYDCLLHAANFRGWCGLAQCLADFVYYIVDEGVSCPTPIEDVWDVFTEDLSVQNGKSRKGLLEVFVQDREKMMRESDRLTYNPAEKSFWYRYAEALCAVKL